MLPNLTALPKTNSLPTAKLMVGIRFFFLLGWYLFQELTVSFREGFRPKATNQVGIPTAKQAEVQGLQILLERWQSNPRFLGSQ